MPANSTKLVEDPLFRSHVNATCAGVEGAISQAVVALAMRRSRYRELAKTNLQHFPTAVAINIKRLGN